MGNFQQGTYPLSPPPPGPSPNIQPLIRRPSPLFSPALMISSTTPALWYPSLLAALIVGLVVTRLCVHLEPVVEAGAPMVVYVRRCSPTLTPLAAQRTDVVC